MLAVDIGLCVPFLLALFFWSRGLWKKNSEDVICGVVVFSIALALYVLLYSQTRLTWIPSVSALAAAAAGTACFRRTESPSRRFAMLLVVIPLCLAVLFFFAERRWNAPANSIFVILPYRHAGTWVFDDERAGLRTEPFVAGAPELIDALLADAAVNDPDKGFRLLFSARPFPHHHEKMVWRRTESGGNWYYSGKHDAEGWLCPALFKYFRRPPGQIYVKVEPLSN